MRIRWHYVKQALRANRPLFVLLFCIAAALGILIRGRYIIGAQAAEWFRIYGVQAAGELMKEWFPGLADSDGQAADRLTNRSVLFSYLEEMEAGPNDSEDPAYERMLAEAWEKKRRAELESGRADGGTDTGQAGNGNGTDRTGNDASSEKGASGGGDAEKDKAVDGGGSGNLSGSKADIGETGTANTGGDRTGAADKNEDNSGDGSGMAGSGEGVAGWGQTSEAAVNPSQSLIQEKLADYDYLIKSFYNVHPTTTAGRDFMNAGDFQKMDLSIEKDADKPQILIYHTHSQEEFADYADNPQATIVGVGEHLAGLLRARGYQVVHDTSVYDFREGKLDRSRAYTYALEGVNGILQKYPSIEVVLDIHRDGVAGGTRLVTEIDGKPTAKIMFFNGLSQTPDGPIEYLPNPNRDANLAFSFQMQLEAAKRYPGYTRKIYLKGLRYNQHVRARSALIEVGAQTNTYEEAQNAMEPLADLLDYVLTGEHEE